MGSSIGPLILWCSVPFVLLGLFVGLSIVFRFKRPGVYIAMVFAILVTLGVLVSVFDGMVMIGLMAAPYGFVAGLFLGFLFALPADILRCVRDRNNRPRGPQ